MECPFCGSEQVFVANSRPTRKNTEVWRRRKCESCKNYFTTHEKIDLSYITLIKKDGRRVRYNRTKLFSGIYHAIVFGKKVDRGSSAVAAEEVTQILEGLLVHRKVKEIKTSEMTDLVMQVLKQKQPSALLRYLAYFVNPKNYKEIRTEIRKI